MKLTIKPMITAILAVLFAVVLACGLQVRTVNAEEMQPTEQTMSPTLPTILPTLPTISPEMLKEFPPCKPGESELIVCNPNSGKEK